MYIRGIGITFAHHVWRTRYPGEPSPYSAPTPNQWPGARDAQQAEFLALVEEGDRSVVTDPDPNVRPTEAQRSVVPNVRPALEGVNPAWIWQADYHTMRLVNTQPFLPPDAPEADDIIRRLASFPTTASTATLRRSLLATASGGGGVGGAVNWGSQLAGSLGISSELYGMVRQYLAGGLAPRIVLGNVIGMRNLLIAEKAPRRTIAIFNKAVAQTAMWYKHFFDRAEDSW